MRASVLNRVQIGMESTPGSAVAATKRLLATYFRPRPRVPTFPFRPAGSKFNTGRTLGKEHVEAEISGAPSYTDMTYLLSSLCHKAAVAGTWTWTPTLDTVDVPQTYTVEHGPGGGGPGEKFAYGLVTGLTIRFSPNTAPELRGGMIGQKVAFGAALTAADVDDVPKALIDPASVTVLVGDSVAGLAALDYGLEVELNMSAWWGPLFTLNAGVPSFKTHVSLAPEFTARLVVAQDSVSAGYLDDLRTSKQKFLRISAAGGEFDVGENYLFQATVPFLFQEPDLGDNQGAEAATYMLMPDHESGLDTAVEFVLMNGLATL